MVVPALAAAAGAYAIGKGIDFAYGAANAYQQYNYNSSLMDKQNDLNKDYSAWNYSNAMSLQRAGLEKAGYNPLLAVNNGVNYSSGSTGLGSVNMADSHSDFNANLVAKRQTSVQERVGNSQVNANNASALKATEEAKTQESVRANNEAQTALTNINTELTKKNLSWVDRLNLNQIKTNLMNATANQANAAASKINAGASVTNAQSAMINAKTNQKYRPWEVGEAYVGLAGKALGGSRIARKFKNFLPKVFR